MDLCLGFHPWYAAFTSDMRFIGALCHEIMLFSLLLFNYCSLHRVLQKENWDEELYRIWTAYCLHNLCNSGRDPASELFSTEMQEQKI